jgi:hypothetical protein
MLKTELEAPDDFGACSFFLDWFVPGLSIHHSLTTVSQMTAPLNQARVIDTYEKHRLIEKLPLCSSFALIVQPHY